MKTETISTNEVLKGDALLIDGEIVTISKNYIKRKPKFQTGIGNPKQVTGHLKHQPVTEPGFFSLKWEASWLMKMKKRILYA